MEIFPEEITNILSFPTKNKKLKTTLCYTLSILRIKLVIWLKSWQKRPFSFEYY